jgi:alkanesulfonate monooxygenase SsuD/methylene tetrahydromethanopterin reductase-like flavin-dependent oxidoreductase (luciferase family)
VVLIKRLFHEETVTFSGTHYSAQNAQLTLKPTQHPHPPLFIGGGGKRILSLAGREADIISFDLKGTASGPKDFATASPTVLDQQIGWVRETAGPRFDTLELHLLVYCVAITEHRHQAAEQIVEFGASVPPSMMINTQVSIEDVLASPRFLIGTVDEIVDQLQTRREQYGISYITILEFPGFADTDAFSPIVARLVGT